MSARKRRNAGKKTLRVCLAAVVVISAVAFTGVHGSHDTRQSTSPAPRSPSSSSSSVPPASLPPSLHQPSPKLYQRQQQAFVLSSTERQKCCTTTTTPSPHGCVGKSDPSTGPFPQPPRIPFASPERFSTNRPNPDSKSTLDSNPINCLSFTRQQRQLQQRQQEQPQRVYSDSCSSSSCTGNGPSLLHPNNDNDNDNDDGNIDRQETLSDMPQLHRHHDHHRPGACASKPPGPSSFHFSKGQPLPLPMINPRQHFPEPIIFQYTLYYPGNIPLVITAGHGGSTTPGKPVKSKVTHRFVRVPDLELTTLPIEVSTFSVPVSSGEEDEEEEVMPWMPPRDQTKGGNFKMDLNTHATALNIANAVACLTSGIGHDRGRNGEGLQREDNNMTKSIPEGCEGPWGDRDSDFPFPPSPSPSSSYLQQQATAASASSSGNTRTKRSQGSRVYNYPHLVVFRVPRLFVDVNRNVTGENAIADHPVSEAAWREYHDVVDHVQKMILQQREREQKGKKPETESDTPTFPSGPGLLLDIHGHVHATNLIEIGYLMNGSVLAMDDEQLDTHAHMLAKESSIRSLVSRVTVANDGASSAPVLPTPPSTQISLASGRHCQDQQEDDKENSKLAFSTLLRGRNDSLGGMLQAQGLNSLPSPEHLAPCQECIFFFGGYTIQAHGTRDREYSTDAIQLELPRTLRLVAKEEGREIGMQLGKAVVEYMAKHYGVFEEYVSANSSSDAKSTFTAASVRNGVASRVGMREAGAKRVALERSMSQPYRPAAAATGLHSYHRTRSESRENHSGDSDIEDGMASSNRHPEMKRQSSRL